MRSAPIKWFMSTCFCLAVWSGCGDDDDTGIRYADGGAAITRVAVSVKEFSVIASPAVAPAGQIMFVVTNEGSEGHEFEVIKTNLAPDALPIENHRADTSANGVNVIDEVESIQPGGQRSLAVSLTAGKYVLVCNRVESLADGGFESHYQAGMRTAFQAL